MITTVLVYMLVGVLTIVLIPLYLLPDAVLPSSVTGSLAAAGNYVHLFALFLPIATIFAILGLYAATELSIFSWKIINWLIRKIPTIS